MIVVSDTSVLNAFYKIRQIALLPALYGRVVIPNKVFDEALADDELGRWLRTIHPSWIDVLSVGNASEVQALLFDMDPGEAEALVLARELNAEKVLMDDHEGRKVAQRWGLSVVGTLGILLAAKTEGLIPEVRPLVQALIDDANFWVSETLQKQVLAQAQEL
jgi:predicted nucleic acid-binding protein